MDQSDRFYTMFHNGFYATTTSSWHEQRKPHIEQTKITDTYRRHHSRTDTSYRRSRSAANLRERRRMQCINKAFEGLRSHIPTLPYEKRLSKVDTLRLSICYINFLTELINTNSSYTDEEELHSQKYTESQKVVIYNVRKETQANHELPLVRGHSLSWSCEKGKQKSNLIKTTKIWRPEDPRKAKQLSMFDIKDNSV